jgi:hypothetical protein
VLLDYKPRVLEQMTIGYIEHLRDKGRAPKTISLHVAAILHFFEMNDIVLNKRKITRFIPPDVSAYHSINDKVYTHEEYTESWRPAMNEPRLSSCLWPLLVCG